MSDSISNDLPGALTSLTEEEEMFREAVRDFAESEISPLVHEMDENQAYHPDLLPQLFELGLMGIEIPEDKGGAGSSFFTSCLIVEELSRVDPAVGTLVDVQNTLCINALLRWGTDAQKERLLPRLAADTV